MSDYEAMDQTEGDDDLWHVQLRNGEVCMMTLEQLDDAFQEGVISENTYLWQEGATGWVTLREVAGLDSDDDSAAIQENPFVQPDHASASVWPTAPAVASYQYASTQDIYAPPLQNMGPHSTAPVVSPLGMDLDLDNVDFGKKKRSGGKWLVAAALIGAAGFGATKYKMLPIPDIGGSPSVNTQALTAAAAIPVEATPVPPTPAPPPPAAAPAPAPQPQTVPAKVNLDDQVKERLAKADKALAEKQKAKQQQLQQRHSVSSRSSRPRASAGEKVFHKGGEVGDPLNSAL